MVPSLMQLMAWLLFVISVLAIPSTSSFIVPTASDCTTIQAVRLGCANKRVPYFKRSTCCQDTLTPFMEDGFCVDLDNDLDFCGSCTQRCSENQDCCHGICTNVYGDRSNCGVCGLKCDEDEDCKTVLDDDAADPVGFPVCSPRTA